MPLHPTEVSASNGETPQGEGVGRDAETDERPNNQAWLDCLRRQDVITCLRIPDALKGGSILVVFCSIV